MATIIIRNSTGSGAVPSSLVQGELAINTVDGKLFYGSGSGNVVKEFTGSGGGGGSTNTGSLLTTASFSNPNLTFTKGDSSTFNVNLVSLVPTSASFATSSSYAANGGVTQLLAGSNITLSPTTGKGQVTISATGGGGPFYNTATGSYGSFYDTTTQTNPVANVPRSMSFNTTDITNGVSISGSTSPFNTYIKTENPGVYNIQFSAQLDKTDSGTDEIVIWLRKNGSDLTDTATTITLNGNNDKQVAAWNWFVNSAANDYYQIIWYSADTDLRLLAETAGGGHPGIPSIILTVNRVDQFLSNTGSFSGSFNGSHTGLFSGSFTGSLLGTASWANNALTASIAGTAASADTAKAVVTIANTTNADFYPTFVDSNNTPTAASEIVYTSNRITFNPSTQVFASTNIFATSITASRFTGSLTGSLLGTASYATQALSASWAPSVASNPFPYTGSAIISGSLTITGSLRVGVPGANNATIDTTVGTLGRGTQAKVDWVNGYLNNSSEVTSVDWESAFLNDSNAITRVDWGNGSLNDSAGTAAFDWESRRMIDAAGARSADFDVRYLIYPNGTTTAINYGTQNQIAMTGSVSITGSLTVSGSSTFTNIGPAIFSGSVNSQGGFTGSLQGTASYATVAQTLLGSVTSASFASTASFVNTLNQNVLITGSLTVGLSSLGPSENTLTLGARDAVNEGGQVGFNAPGGSYTSASFLDLYQNRFRILKGTDAGSTGEVAYWDLQTLQMAIPAYTSTGSFTGTPVAALGVDSSGKILSNLSPIRNIQNVADGTAVTGTTSGTLTKSILIPANTVGVNDVIYIKTRARKTGTAGTLIVRMYVNTSAAIGGSLIATSGTNAASTLYFQYTRTAVVKSTTNTETMAGNFNVNTDERESSAAVSTSNIDWTVNQYLVVVHTNSSAADSSVNSFAHIQINKG